MLANLARTEPGAETTSVRTAQPFSTFSDAETFVHHATMVLPFTGIRPKRKFRPGSFESDAAAHLELVTTKCSKTMALLLLRRRVVWPMFTQTETYNERRTRQLFDLTKHDDSLHNVELPDSVRELVRLVRGRLEPNQYELYLMALLPLILRSRAMGLEELQKFMNHKLFSTELWAARGYGGSNRAPEAAAAAILRAPVVSDWAKKATVDQLIEFLGARCSLIPDCLQP